ncbi:hypothetical protein ACOCJ5_10345 [Knoellia sp. CPCC 206450]|uniref:hypothetical protein n=1 Tax=Knoellia tibetensis TaxID=3404798 RepID=UPI003B43AA8D
MTSTRALERLRARLEARIGRLEDEGRHAEAEEARKCRLLVVEAHDEVTLAL